jgi:light-regulated signal transduction histidine kinase (bacteriophytochrome)
LIRCADTGPGLPAEAYGRVFEPFWRADDSRARASGGSGLGLSVVRAIAIAHHGDAIVRPGEAGGVTVAAIQVRVFGSVSRRSGGNLRTRDEVAVLGGCCERVSLGDIP